MAAPKVALCSRCKEALANDSSYCLACGYQNTDELLARKAELEHKADLRIAFQRWLVQLMSPWRYWRR